MKPAVIITFFFAAIVSSSCWVPSAEPDWDKLSVTWGLNIWTSFNALPMTKQDAINEGWKLTKSCDDKSFFAGNRYMLDGDTATMLLYDSQGKIAGIQAGVKKSKVKPKTFPWNEEGDTYVMTAYFTDPANICKGSRPPSDYLGDKLLIQTGSKPSDNMLIPYKEGDLKGTKWVTGQCFKSMGQHYWYDISRGMNCDDFYPVFLLYNSGRLNGFGWNTDGDLKSSRYEHPTPPRLHFFFKEETLPQCLMTAGPLSTQHIFLDKRPYFNFC